MTAGWVSVQWRGIKSNWSLEQVSVSPTVHRMVCGTMFGKRSGGCGGSLGTVALAPNYSPKAFYSQRRPVCIDIYTGVATAVFLREVCIRSGQKYYDYTNEVRFKLFSSEVRAFAFARW